MINIYFFTVKIILKQIIINNYLKILFKKYFAMQKVKSVIYIIKNISFFFFQANIFKLKFLVLFQLGNSVDSHVNRDLAREKRYLEI